MAPKYDDTVNSGPGTACAMPCPARNALSTSSCLHQRVAKQWQHERGHPRTRVLQRDKTHPQPIKRMPGPEDLFHQITSPRNTTSAATPVPGLIGIVGGLATESTPRHSSAPPNAPPISSSQLHERHRQDEQDRRRQGERRRVRSGHNRGANMLQTACATTVTATRASPCRIAAVPDPCRCGANTAQRRTL